MRRRRHRLPRRQRRTETVSAVHVDARVRLGRGVGSDRPRGRACSARTTVYVSTRAGHVNARRSATLHRGTIDRMRSARRLRGRLGDARGEARDRAAHTAAELMDAVADGARDGMDGAGRAESRATIASVRTRSEMGAASSRRVGAAQCFTPCGTRAVHGRKTTWAMARGRGGHNGEPQR